jgi:phosphoketolase
VLARRNNPLLREPLRLKHVRDRLLGHWAASRAGAHAKERFRNYQIQCRLYAREHGVDPQELVSWCRNAR